MQAPTFMPYPCLIDIRQRINQYLNNQNKTLCSFNATESAEAAVYYCFRHDFDALWKVCKLTKLRKNVVEPLGAWIYPKMKISERQSGLQQGKPKSGTYMSMDAPLSDTKQFEVHGKREPKLAEEYMLNQILSGTIWKKVRELY